MRQVSSREAAAKLAKYDRDKSGAMEIDEFALLVDELRRAGYEILDAELAKLQSPVTQPNTSLCATSQLATA